MLVRSRLERAQAVPYPESPSMKPAYEFGPFRLDSERGLLLRNDQPVPLTQKSFEILLVLIENREDTVSKDVLLKRVWPDTFVDEANLTQHISVLRKALGETPQDRRFIVTVPGRGYRFVAAVREVSDGNDPLPDPAAPELSAIPESTAVQPEVPVGVPADYGRSQLETEAHFQNRRHQFNSHGCGRNRRLAGTLATDPVSRAARTRYSLPISKIPPANRSSMAPSNKD